jgi:hypothetical protein
MGVLFVICGVVAIAGGVFGKQFYVADVLGNDSYKRRSSTWSGRLIFILVGVFFLAVGIKFLVD